MMDALRNRFLFLFRALISPLLSFLSSTLILSTTPVSRNGHRRNKQRERDLSVFDPLGLISEEADILIDSFSGISDMVGRSFPAFSGPASVSGGIFSAGTSRDASY